jgi:hypothetical protein
MKASLKLIGSAYGLFAAKNGYTLYKVEKGETEQVSSGGRLQAFKVTGNGNPNTWKRAIHADIGAIYVTMGKIGEERIGDVFSSKKMQDELSKSVSDKGASLEIAKIEAAYWEKVKAEDATSIGGKLGSAFDPATRNAIQSTTAQAMGFIETISKKSEE